MILSTTYGQPLKIEVVGDSILKGVQLDESTDRYVLNNNIDTAYLEKKYNLKINNRSAFGCTVTKGIKTVARVLGAEKPCDALVVNFGGNDCDFYWKEISDNPDGEHLPHTPKEQFRKIYTEMIQMIKERGITPVAVTLPPLDSDMFFERFCGGLDTQNVMKWLKRRSIIFEHHAEYSHTVECVAKEFDVPVVDIRSAFLAEGHYSRFLCRDGTHPNTDGQRIITRTFDAFAQRYLGGGNLIK